MIFDQYYDKIAARQPFVGNTFLNPDFVNKTAQLEDVPWSWDEAMAFLDTHPSDLLDTHPEKQRYFLKQAHQRASAPLFAKEIMQYMQQIFHQNSITNIVFMGIGPDTESYPRHADTMDVFLVQITGHVNIKVEGFANEEKFCLSPNDFVYIPRGLHHQIIPHESRITMSFGVEGDPDPSTYVLPQ